MKRRLTIQEVDNIIFIHKYRQCLPESMHPYFDWWVDMVSTGQYKVPEYKEGWHSEVEMEVWLPPELRNTQVEKEEEDVYY